MADEAGLPVYRHAPCRDIVVILRGSELQVNGRTYGKLAAGDKVHVDHGEVSIHGGAGSPYDPSGMPPFGKKRQANRDVDGVLLEPGGCRQEEWLIVDLGLRV